MEMYSGIHNIDLYLLLRKRAHRLGKRPIPSTLMSLFQV